MDNIADVILTGESLVIPLDVQFLVGDVNADGFTLML